jgi:glycosyltransferase involved in cell wall biosynthesis
MRVLALSHSAVVDAYREKFRLLAARKGWDLHLALPHAWPEGGKDIGAKAGKEGRLTVHVLPCRLRGRVGFSTLAGLKALAEKIRPELVYAEEEPYSLAVNQALNLGRPTVFYTWENMDRRYKPPLNWVRGRVLRKAAAGVAGNAEGMGLLRGWGFDKPLLLQPQYGIDTRRFKPAKKTKRPFTAGYFGRLIPEKGVDLLLKAASLAQVPVRIGGQGPEERALRLQCDALGVDADFTGFVPFAKRAAFYASVDALVLPSRATGNWKEQFGRVLAEAMACGLPCVGAASGAIPEVMGAGGLVFEENDAAGLAGCLKRLKASAALRARLGKAGRARALRHFEERQLVDDLGAFLEKAV